VADPGYTRGQGQGAIGVIGDVGAEGSGEGIAPFSEIFFSILDLKMATSGVFWALFFTVQLRVSYIIALPTGAANYAQNVTVDTARGKDASIIYLKKMIM